MDLDCDELYKWIDEHPITRQKRNINRDFADAVPLAEILKQHYPKLVDLHNYSPRNSFSQKLINWDILNKRVLSKIGINISSTSMEQLAKGTPGAIEKLLSNIKIKLDSKASGDNNTTVLDDKVYYLENASNFSSKDGIVPVKIKNGLKTVDRKMVSNEVFEKMEKDIAEKDETISVLENKIEHLENLMAVKEERIKDLTQQLQTVVNVTTSQSNLSSPKTRFFNKIF
ncbi:hypothetical protein NQ314_007870 [Rhamnusium bicolor]|uniref:Calponin-homology (CH) domain-containing protein n=1 Tax=Rhamnusium bicolor TaxID=1586634 RepID=A0AAV8YI23_9CUCU|nr:hypothetical protein NQ314_007870 [Rhamnusium bicolor]